MMFFKNTFIFLCLLANIFLFTSCTNFTKQKSETNLFPDFCQCDKRYGSLPKEGKPYCGPTALSNVLVYLDRQGFLNLLLQEDPTAQNQFNLIKLLGSKKYLNTSPKAGTEPIDLMRVLEKYVKEKGYETSIKWKGWTKGGSYTTGAIPDSIWLRDEL